MKNLVSRAALTASVALGTLMVSVPAFAAEEVSTENPYGLRAALEQGGPIAQGTFAILVLMSLFSWYIIFTKWWDQRKLLIEAKDLDKKFWSAPSLKDGAAKLDKNSAFRQIVDDGLRAADHHEGRLTDTIDKNEWVTMSLARSTHAINAKLQGGLAFLASVGSTSPFVGLFGTVVGIYRALINIGVAGQASIDKVAGPVGEALIMTALGLLVAVPAVLAYNYLQARNKRIAEELSSFSTDVMANINSRGAVRPSASTAAAKAAPAPAKPAAAPAKP